MEGMERYESHPARDMAVRSMTAVEAGDRETWLSLFAEDALMEDPIGPSAFDPEGKGHRGVEAIGRFWDETISKSPVRLVVRESYAAGNECANVATITLTMPDGSRAIVDGVFTYRIDDAGLLAALRAYWEQDKIRFEPAPAPAPVR
jgi:ketosteroid isomerase-like protein